MRGLRTLRVLLLFMFLVTGVHIPIFVYSANWHMNQFSRNRSLTVYEEEQRPWYVKYADFLSNELDPD